METSSESGRTVFISYARDDHELVLPVVQLLKAAGVTVLVDHEVVPYGDLWEETLLELLLASERVLVFWSANAQKSKWVRREVTLAGDAGIRLVPVPLDDTDLPQALSKYQALMELVPLIYAAQEILRRQATASSWQLLERWRPFQGDIMVLSIGFSAAFALYSALSPDKSQLVPEAVVAVLVAHVLVREPSTGFLARRRELKLREAIIKCIFSRGRANNA